jgi:hypothetical protein
MVVWGKMRCVVEEGVCVEVCALRVCEYFEVHDLYLVKLRKSGACDKTQGKGL